MEDRLLCQVGGVGRGCDAGQLLDGAIGHAGKHIGQIPANGDAQPATGLDNTEDGGDLGSSLFTSHMQPIFPADRHSPDILPMSVRN